jgi:outer membrane protein TolC
MRWTTVLGLVVLGLVPGCTQQCYISEYDAKHYAHLMPENLEHRADAGQVPTDVRVAKPRDVDHLAGQRRYLSLNEAIAYALENGTTGVLSVNSPGAAINDLLSAAQLQSLQSISDSNKVLSINPAIAGAQIEANLARFDVLSITNTSWSATDLPNNGLTSFQNGSGAHVEESLVKPLPTGGVAGITFSTDYTLLSSPPTGFSVVNPSYQPKLTFTFDHPLVRDFGSEINQLLTLTPQPSPGSSLSPFAQAFLGQHGATNASIAGVPLSGILISRLRFDQSRADFERIVNFKLLNIETAYWNLYAAYVNLYASEQGLRQAHQAWLETQLRFAAGAVSEAEVAVARGQYEQFRGDRIQSLEAVLESERQLRVLMGLPVEDGYQLIPADPPTVAPYLPDWDSAVNEALALRPELIAARQELKVRQFNVLAAQNYLKPDLRFNSAYQLIGLGTSLDGDGTLPGSSPPVTSNALKSLTGGHFADWNLGLTLNMPLGWRFEHAAVRQQKLQLAQAHLALQREERKAQEWLAKAWRDVLANYKTIEARRSQRIAFAKQVEAEYQLVRLGKVTVRFLLDAERQFATALAQEAQSIVAYNNSLAMFEFAKGTIMQHDNVQIGEGPLPQCCQARAVEHERERTTALVLRERSSPVQQRPLTLGHETAVIPNLPSNRMPALPALLESEPSLPGQASNPPVQTQAPTPLVPAKATAPVAPAPATLPVVPTQTTPTLPPFDSGPLQVPLTSSPAGPQAQAAPVTESSGPVQASFQPPPVKELPPFVNSRQAPVNEVPPFVAPGQPPVNQLPPFVTPGPPPGTVPQEFQWQEGSLPPLPQ